MTNYRLAKCSEGWAVLDSSGQHHGTQPTRQEGKKLLQIIRHMGLARVGFLTWN